ncbi:hypothetical protein ECANGB1_1331 [Enterospora canceri]|uniref:Uncharacterized protein n=1 Tax=Enterospora canceri TaxID=1081671 RepID=A0A1Y1S411_9MICR|nr:hypothetical protein ECANGB1_1331 [Enterospora canceri]
MNKRMGVTGRIIGARLDKRCHETGCLRLININLPMFDGFDTFNKKQQYDIGKEQQTGQEDKLNQL